MLTPVLWHISKVAAIAIVQTLPPVEVERHRLRCVRIHQACRGNLAHVSSIDLGIENKELGASHHVGAQESELGK